jgi:ketosteroid isomerase-like protein
MQRLLVLFIPLALSCLWSRPLRATDTSPEISRAIEEVIAAQVAAWNAGDHEGFMRGYLKSDDIRFLSGDHITRGWATVLARYQKRYPDKATMGTLTLSDFEFTTLGPDAVLVIGRWKVETKKHKAQHGVTSLIFRLTHDGWRIVHDHTS